jgi:uncharacterized membrane protein
METERGVERLIFFTDAVVAIAITLLILPLVELVTPAGDSDHPDLPKFLADNHEQIFAFALSFVIIARLWMANHEILANTVRATPALMWLDVAWVFTIVVLPLPTEITAVFPTTELSVTLYIGCGLASTLLLTGLSYYLYKNPRLEQKGKPTSAVEVWGIGTTAAAFALALLLVLIYPPIGYWSMLALLLTFPLDVILKPRIRKRESRKAN